MGLLLVQHPTLASAGATWAVLLIFNGVTLCRRRAIHVAAVRQDLLLSWRDAKLMLMDDIRVLNL